jgi:hypothetical protein
MRAMILDEPRKPLRLLTPVQVTFILCRGCHSEAPFTGPKNLAVFRLKKRDSSSRLYRSSE